VLLIVDVGAAQVLKQLLPGWNTTATERRYRVPSDVYHHDLAKSADAVAMWGGTRYRVRTNSRGFKDATTREIPLTQEGPRVLLIGDSFTEGIGLPFERSYAGIIAQRLGAGGVEVLNAGVSSYSPAIYYAKVRYLVEEVGLQFAELVVFMDISDIANEAWLYDVDERGRVTLDTGSAPPHALTWSQNQKARGAGFAARQFLKSNSVIIRTLDVARDQVVGDHRQVPLTGITEALWTVNDSHFDAYGRLGLAKADRNMDRLAALLRRKGILLTVAVYPWPDQVMEDSAGSRQVTHWRSWAERAGARFIDLFEPFYRSPDREATINSYYQPGDVHFNEAGSRLVAAAFLAAYEDLMR
jgi:lysophospholipase L1-like esterase